MACAVRATAACLAGRASVRAKPATGRRAAVLLPPTPMRAFLARVLSSGGRDAAAGGSPRARHGAPAITHAAAPASDNTPPPSADFPGRLVRVSHILLRPDTADPAGRLDELERAARAGGVDAFAAAARAQSACPSGAAAGGDLGFIARGATVPPFEDAAFACAVGGFARATTDFGHHLLTVTAERAGPVPVRQLGVLDLKALLDGSGGGDHAAAAAAAAEVAEAVAAGADPPAGAGGGGDPLQLVDVREGGEFATAAIPGFELRPLSAFDPAGLDPAVRTIVLCHHGVRSMRVATHLVEQCGFRDVWNVSGGIDAYARLADRSVPLY